MNTFKTKGKQQNNKNILALITMSETKRKKKKLIVDPRIRPQPNNHNSNQQTCVCCVADALVGNGAPARSAAEVETASENKRAKDRTREIEVDWKKRKIYLRLISKNDYIFVERTIVHRIYKQHPNLDTHTQTHREPTQISKMLNSEQPSSTAILSYWSSVPYRKLRDEKFLFCRMDERRGNDTVQAQKVLHTILVCCCVRLYVRLDDYTNAVCTSACERAEIEREKYKMQSRNEGDGRTAQVEWTGTKR